MNADRIETARARLNDVMDMLKAATGLSSWQVLVEEKLPDDTVILGADDIYRLYDLLHDAYVAVCFATWRPRVSHRSHREGGRPDEHHAHFAPARG